MKNVRKYRNMKLAAAEERRNYLVLQPSYYNATFFRENSLATEMRKAQIFMNKPAYLGLSILELIKIVMYKFCYDYVKRKYEKLCYITVNITMLYGYRRFYYLHSS